MAVSFIFGGDTNETPESIRRKRQIAQALLASQGAPRNVGEGLNALGDGIVSAVLNSRADKAEKVGMESASNDFAPLVSGFGGSGTPGAMGSSMPKVDSAGNVALPSAGGDLPSSFLAAVDKTEGAGGYDTLFGNAQKGQFAGTTVSGMPIRDVLAFTDPSGAYAQSVKSKIGRVATPVGRYQVVGTTLRNAVNDLGLDPNAPFDQATQDKVAAHLARQRIASASTPEGKIAALRSEWHGFKNVPDAQMLQIVNDLEKGPSKPVEVASLDPAAGIPDAPIQPPVIPPAPPPTPGYIDPRVTTDNQQPASPTNVPPPMPNPGQASSPVASALMVPQKGGRVDTAAIPPQVGPQSALPPLPFTNVGPTPTVASVAPVAETAAAPNPQVAQALLNDRSGVGIGGDAPGQGYFPAAPGIQGQSGPSTQQILKVLTNPYATDSQRAVAQALLKRSMDANDPDAQLDRDYKRAQISRLNRPDYRPLAPEERAKYGIQPDDTRPYQLGPDGQVSAIGGQGQAVNPGVEARQRESLARQYGIDPNSAEGQRFILTGTLPTSDKGVTAGDREAIRDADDAVMQGQNTLGILDKALEMSPNAYEGAGSGLRALVMSQFGDKDANTTREFDNLIKEQALGQLKAIFGAAPTEGERAILLDIQGSSNQPRAVRENILKRARALVERRIAYNQDRAAELRGGTYYRPRATPDASSVPPPAGNSAAPEQPAPAANGGAPASPEVSADIQAARDAIAKGAPRDKVIERLQAAGIDTTGL